MAARKPAAPRAPRAPVLPPVTVARFEEAMRLLEQVVDEQTDVFIARGQAYREKHRDGTSRPLSAEEAGSIAAGLAVAHGEPPIAFAEQLQASDLRAHEQPEPVEVLLAAGVATAPAFTTAVLRLVALVEMPAIEFRAHVDDGTLSDALDAACEELRWVDLAEEGLGRAHAAFEHFARAAGVEPGKAVGLVSRAVWQALNQAMSSLGVSASSSSTGLPASTDGAELTFSTA